MPKSRKQTQAVARRQPRPLRRSNRRRQNLLSRMPQMSQQGLNFIKCAFAPPDFANDPGMGIPDAYDGKTLMRKDQLSSSISMSPGTDMFIATVPLPGVSFIFCNVAAGTFPTASSTWSSALYPGYFNTNGLAAPSQGAWTNDNVTAFRYASSCVGIYPTSSVVNSSGAIQVWKANVRLQLSERLSAGLPVSIQYAVSGLESAQAVGPENFTTKFIDGIYSASGSNQPDFPFQNIVSGLSGIPASGIPSADVDQFGAVSAPTGGIGNVDTTFIRITAPASSSNSFVIKTWNCVEYQVNTNSPLYPYASVSASHDPVAIAYYHKIRKELPLAVIAAQNAGFWDTVRDIMRRVSGTLSVLPGPVGMISKGVNMLLQ